MESRSSVFVYFGRSNENIPPRITHAEVPSHVEQIRDSAFKRHRNLVDILLREGLRSICARAFYCCGSLIRISIPSTVIEIGHNAFNSCEHLREVHLSEGLQTIGDFAFYRCHQLKEISIPASVTDIKTFAFSACVSLVVIDFQEGLRRIEKAAFCRCPSVSTISIPSSVELIQQQAFSGCTGLLGLEFLPRYGSVPVRILKWAFKDCESLVNVLIPVSFIAIYVPGFYDIFAGSTFRGNKEKSNIRLKLPTRYKKLPIHHACSSSSETSLRQLQDALLTSSREGQGTELLDSFEMTPFHCLATSANLRLDYLNALLEAYSADLITAKDQRGKTMVDYFLQQGPSNALPLFQLVLRRTLVDGINGWGLNNKWKSEVLQKVNSFRWEGGIRARREQLSAIQTTFASYVKVEMTSNLELALWKRKILQIERGERIKRQKMDRDALRTICGSNVVIGHVTKFLSNPSSTQMMTSVSFQMSNGITWMPGL
mmetsp:Transcript_34331/g.83297  ORF Transcript_34331/g.83297 Transcript_34331/m.83297 type:complete len:486 (+) Transcript_34331:53-1510(+)